MISCLVVTDFVVLVLIFPAINDDDSRGALIVDSHPAFSRFRLDSKGGFKITWCKSWLTRSGKGRLQQLQFIGFVR